MKDNLPVTFGYAYNERAYPAHPPYIQLNAIYVFLSLKRNNNVTLPKSVCEANVINNGK